VAGAAPASAVAGATTGARAASAALAADPVLPVAISSPSPPSLDAPRTIVERDAELVLDVQTELRAAIVVVFSIILYSKQFLGQCSQIPA